MKKKRVACFFVCSIVCTLGLCVSTRAQSVLASVTGLVLDPNAAAIVEATVIAKNIDTGIETIVQTNSEGLYHFANLEPGNYEFSVSKRGFKVIVKPGVALHIVDTISMNFNMQVGDVRETVTVDAGAPMVNTTNASVSTVVDQAYIKNMPLNGRSFQDLILLTPGIVTQTPQISSVAGTGFSKTGEFSVNGQRQESNYYTVDGVSANVGADVGFAPIQSSGASGSLAASTAFGTTQALVSVDALQEFRVQSSTYSAEYGRNPGGQFAFETKSGTNQWHGTAYDYLRNDIFDATDYFTNYFRSVNPALKKVATRQNDFGGTLGGPVAIPGLYKGKDKTFFFVSYEGLRLTAPQPAAASFVPDAALRTSAPSPLNQLLNTYPVPNGLDDAANGIAEFIGTWSNPNSLNSTGVRFDHAVNDRMRLFFRFSDTDSSTTTRGSSSPGVVASIPPSMNATFAYTLRTYTAGVSNGFTNRLSNEFRVNYSSNEVTSRTVLDAFGGGVPVDLRQLTGFGPGSETDLFLIYGGYFLQLFQSQATGAQRQWNLVDTASLAVGRHQFKFGVDYRRLAPFATPANPQVFYFYLSKSGVQANSAAINPQAFAPAYPLYTNFSAFAQDEWKLSQRLNLSLGLRWEVNPPPGVTQGLKPYTVQGSGPSTWTLAPQGTPLWQTTWYNIAPRLGVAYILHDAPAQETVVRGGVGVFFDTGQQLGSIGFKGPGFSASSSLSGPFPGSPAIPTITNPPVGKFLNVFTFAPRLQLPYTLQWNVSVEQALGRSQALTVSYVGSHAARLLQNNQFRPTSNPLSGNFRLVENGLRSDYGSLQIQFRRRLGRGLTALGSYTWSHCIDYGSTNYDFGYQRGNCDFDVRHNLSAAFSYDLPNVGQNTLEKVLLHHWGLDDRFIARTGFPVTLNGKALLQPDAQVFHAGLSLVPGQPVYLYGDNCTSILQGLKDLAPGQTCPGGRAINPLAFANVSSGLGNAPRNFTRGFGAWQMDLAIRREFPIHERLRLQFRTEAFNIFNHANFGSINPSFGQKTFGQATATLASSLGVLNPLYQQGGPRSMQFALKLVF